MRVLSLLYHPDLSEDDLVRSNCSDRIWLPPPLFQRLLCEGEVGTTCLVRLQNRVGQVAYGVAHGVSPHGNDGDEDDEDVAYVPSWMCEMLEYDMEDVEVVRAQDIALCAHLVLQPHTSSHLAPSVDDVQEFFRDAFEAYTCLPVGATLPLWLSTEQRAVDVTIARVLPEDARVVCIRGGDISLELLPPLDMPSLPAPPAPPVVLPAPLPPAVPPAPATPVQEMARRAALARYAAYLSTSASANTSSIE